MNPNKPQEDAATGEGALGPATNPAGTESGVDEVQNTVKLKLYVDKLEAQIPEIERVCEDSVSRETVIPLKRTVLENAVKFAIHEKFDLESMKVHRVIYDKAKNVIAMCMRIANMDGGNTEIGYTVAGRHGPDSAKMTTIEWIWTSGEDYTMAESGGGVADYKDGKWVETY